MGRWPCCCACLVEAPVAAQEVLEPPLVPSLQRWRADIDPGKGEAYLQRRLKNGGQFQRFENVEQALIGMKCAVVRSDGDIVPTNAGIVFFGRYPQQHVIQDEVVTVE